jgi:hypothetical protein
VQIRIFVRLFERGLECGVGVHRAAEEQQREPEPGARLEVARVELPAPPRAACALRRAGRLSASTVASRQRTSANIGSAATAFSSDAIASACFPSS